SPGQIGREVGLQLRLVTRPGSHPYLDSVSGVVLDGAREPVWIAGNQRHGALRLLDDEVVAFDVRVPGLELDAQPGEALAGRGVAEGIGVTLGVVLRDSILLAAHAVEVAVVDVEPGARSALALDVPLHHVRLVDSVEHRAFALLRRTFDEGPADVDRLLLVGNGECFDHQMALASCSTMRANGSPVAISSCFHWPCEP